MTRMTKADIIETVYEKVVGFSKKEAAEIVEAVSKDVDNFSRYGKHVDDKVMMVIKVL